jgi:isocitrate dehydrogenase
VKNGEGKLNNQGKLAYQSWQTHFLIHGICFSYFSGIQICFATLFPVFILSRNLNSFCSSFCMHYIAFVGLAGNVGAEHAVFEQGASGGNVGSEKLVLQKRANPIALLLSSSMLLRHLQFPAFADRLDQAVMGVIKDGVHRTKDLGGASSTQQVVDAVIEKLG